LAATRTNIGTLVDEDDMMRTVIFVLVTILGVGSPAGAGESRVLGAVLSTLVPGAGEAYLGWRSSAEVFLISEGVVWGGRWFCARRADSVEDEYVYYASQHASSDPSIRDRAYYDDMTRYWNSDRANSHYQDPAKYTGSKVWSWVSNGEMDEFEDLVRDRRNWDSRKKNIMVFAMLNRAASALYCLRANRDDRAENLTLVVHPGSVGMSLRW